MSDELVKQALSRAKGGDDLYALIGGVSAIATVDEIRRAWRKRNLVLHPDKARDAFDPILYASFSEALAILENEASREAYDNSVAAALAQQKKLDEMGAERRRQIEELHEREARGRRMAAGGAPAHRPEAHVKETADERWRRQEREMREEDERRLHGDWERQRRDDEDARERANREQDEELVRREMSVKRKLWGERQRRKRRDKADAYRIARAGAPLSGPGAWAWTRRMLIQEQRLRRKRVEAGA